MFWKNQWLQSIYILGHSPSVTSPSGVSLQASSSSVKFPEEPYPQLLYFSETNQVRLSRDPHTHSSWCCLGATEPRLLGECLVWRKQIQLLLSKAINTSQLEEGREEEKGPSACCHGYLTQGPLGISCSVRKFSQLGGREQGWRKTRLRGVIIPEQWNICSVTHFWPSLLKKAVFQKEDVGVYVIKFITSKVL